MKFSVARPKPGKRSAENFTRISCQISRHLWQRKTEKNFTSALLQGSCSEVCDREADGVTWKRGENGFGEHGFKHRTQSVFVGSSSSSGGELSGFLPAYSLRVKANSPSFAQNSPSLLQNSASSHLRNSTLETVFRPFPKKNKRLMINPPKWNNLARLRWARQLLQSTS